MIPAYLILGCVALAASIMVVASRRIVHSAVFLIVSFLATAGIFLVLGAEFVAAVQVLVYAGSVIVLFVFVVMTVGLADASVGGRSPIRWAPAAIMGLVVFWELVAGLSPLGGTVPEAAPLPPAEATGELGKLLFADWLLPLEVFSLIILAVMVGMAALRREERRPRP